MYVLGSKQTHFIDYMSVVVIYESGYGYGYRIYESGYGYGYAYRNVCNMGYI